MAKILLVIDCLGSGGAQRQLVSLARSFKAAGHHIEFFIYYPELTHFIPVLSQLNIPIHSVNKSSRFSLEPLWALQKLLKKDRFDGALAFMQTPAIYMEAASLLNRMLAIKLPRLVFSERTSYPTKKLSWLFKISQQFHRFSDEIVVNSYHQKENMTQKFPWMKTKVSTIYNGLDEVSFTESQSQKCTITKSDYMLCISRVVEYKNYQNLALSLINYKERWGDPPKIVWVGKIFPQASNLTLLTKIKQQLAEVGLEEHLNFIGEKELVQPYYQNASVLIHPSFIEGFSNVVMEACRYSLPLLLGNIGDHQQMLSKYPAGLIFDVSEPASIAEALHQYRNANVELKAQWRESSLQAYENLFQMKQASESYLTLLLKD